MASKNIDKLFQLNPSELIKNILEELNKSITNTSLDSLNRLKQFEKKYEIDFPNHDDIFTRGMADGIIYAIFDEPLTLYALSMNSLCIIELHGIMERSLLREVPSLISAKGMENHISKLLERKTLLDLSKILQGIKIFDEDDLKLIKKLKDLRDGIAHKNSKLISETLHGSNPQHIHDVDISDPLTITLILSCIRLLTKLAMIKSPTAVSVVE